MGKVLTIIYRVAGIESAMGAENMFQTNQLFARSTTIIPKLQSYPNGFTYDLDLVLLMRSVIIGDISCISIVI